MRTTLLLYLYHSISSDTEAQIATGWNDGQLSPLGREMTEQLRPAILAFDPQIAYCSDLGRAAQTAVIALRDTTIPVLFTRALRECDFGELNGSPTAVVHANDLRYFDRAYPGGESYAQAAARTIRFLEQTVVAGPERRVLVIGHGVTRAAVKQLVTGASLETIMSTPEQFQFPDDWNNRGQGWIYEINV